MRAFVTIAVLYFEHIEPLLEDILEKIVRKHISFDELINWNNGGFINRKCIDNHTNVLLWKTN